MASMNDILSMPRLPAMPATLARAIPILLDPASDWAALERVVRNDPALTAAILRLANSAIYGSPGKHFDLRPSMTRLGRDILRRFLLEQQVAGVVNGDNAAFGLQVGALWRSSLAGALAAEDLAKDNNFPEPALAFVAALLRDIGKLALNVRYADAYPSLIARHAKPGLSHAQAERAALGFDHAQLGAALARKWNLPERIAAAIEFHHEPPPPGTNHDTLFDIVHAADTIARWAGLGIGNDGLEYRLSEHVRQGLALDRKTAELDIALLWTQLCEAEESFGIASSPATKQGAAA